MTFSSHESNILSVSKEKLKKY